MKKRQGAIKKVPASEFARNFGEFRELAQREPVAVTNHGRTSGYFISAEHFEECQRQRKLSQRAVKVADLPEKTIKAIANARMDKRHGHLNKLLDNE